MTTIFHLGTPKNDGWQWLENRYCRRRLVSLYQGYRAPVLQWARDTRACRDEYAQAMAEGREHDDFAFYARRYPALRQKIALTHELHFCARENTGGAGWEDYKRNFLSLADRSRGLQIFKQADRGKLCVPIV